MRVGLFYRCNRLKKGGLGLMYTHTPYLFTLYEDEDNAHPNEMFGNSSKIISTAWKALSGDQRQVMHAFFTSETKLKPLY